VKTGILKNTGFQYEIWRAVCVRLGPASRYVSSSLVSYFKTLCLSLFLISNIFVIDAVAQAARGAVKIAPHRAVYDISLVDASVGSGIVAMSGRMVYELSGNACQGYTQKMRFVTRITDRNGTAQVNDLRSSSWEGGASERLRFHLSQYQNDRLTETTLGAAGRLGGSEASFNVKLEKPRRKDFRVDRNVYFPMQHSIALIEAAKAGRSLMTAKVYDGSEKGEKVYLTSAYIGKKLPAGSQLISPKVNKVLAVKSWSAWPVSISFFEPGDEHIDAVPVYELSFRFIENGISTRIHIDYGDFSVNGELRELSLLKQSACDASPKSQ